MHKFKPRANSGSANANHREPHLNSRKNLVRPRGKYQKLKPNYVWHEKMRTYSEEHAARE